MANSGKFFIKDLKPSEIWFADNATKSIYVNANFKDKSELTTLTIAIARTANKMYTFVDGALVKEFDVPEDYIGVTTPGIIACSRGNNFTVNNVKLLSGEDAQTKISELTATNA